LIRTAGSYSWSYLGAVPAAKLRRIEQERAAEKEQARKLTRKEAADAERLARLENLRRSTAVSRPPSLGKPICR
jgi:hypothetical protein